ncbi:MAG: glycine--tRNA ligase subunit beta, partial [Pseudomonadota bacterium]
MPDLLLELFSEEIPARMQAKAEADLLKAVLAKLDEAGLARGEGKAWSTPRRLGVHVADVATRSKDVREERKGPKVGAPEKAVAGFLRGAGLETIDQADVRSDPKKGDFYVAIKETPGRAATDIIAEAVPDIIRGFHWPKSMRTGTGELRWVRPLQRILCVLGGKTVAFEVDGLQSGNETEGHRVHGRGPFKVESYQDYAETLEGEGRIILTRDTRRAMIEAQAERLCADNGLELIEDKGLLEEVVGLVELPVAILGEMDPAFLGLPPEVVQLSMRTHQKYFAVNDAKTGSLVAKFIVVANIDPADGGAAIAAGNAKVLSARLDDARFFWENDRKTGLEAMAPKLAKIAFKEELGSLGDKVERVAALARELAPKVGADPDLAERAARLAKADLVSEMVYEFPELQGVMGRYYALEADEDEAVANAIADHYKPQGPSDAVPTAPVSIAVALADKLDTLVGFWAIDEKPTGSKDPFALRRAALGVVRIVLENGVRFPNQFKNLNPSDIRQLSPDELAQLELGFEHVLDMQVWKTALASGIKLSAEEAGVPQNSSMLLTHGSAQAQLESGHAIEVDGEASRSIAIDLLSFFADRLKQVLRDEGKRHDLIDAVFALGEDDLVLIVKRVEALTAFLASDDGANLLAGYKRAANILKAEEKKDGEGAFAGAPETALMGEDVERALLVALDQAEPKLEQALGEEDFEGAMKTLADLRAPLDAFFEGVMVNDQDQNVRRNRLRLLGQFR